MNAVHYRLSGFDSDDRRLFDAPPARVPVIVPPRLDGLRVKWEPIDPDGELPEVRCVFTLATAGWRHVVLEQVSGSAAGINQRLPAPPINAPVRAVMVASLPSWLEFAGREGGRWRSQRIEHVIDQQSGDAPRGVVPTLEEGELAFRFAPDESAFEDVRVGEGSVTFRPAGGGEAQTLEAPPTPAPRRVTATPFDHAVRLSWDATALRAGRSRFDAPVRVAVYRYDDEQTPVPKLLATLPPDADRYTDTTAPNGSPCRYELAVVREDQRRLDPLLEVRAWVEGVGETPLRIAASPRVAVGPVVPHPALDRLNVALGPHELCYPDTGVAAAQVIDALLAAFESRPGTAMLDRQAMMVHSARSATGVGALGAPAHVVLRLVDETGPDGSRLALWATDLVTGESRRLAEAALRDLRPDAFATAADDYLAPRAADTDAPPYTVTPGRLVFGPLHPVDEAHLYHAAEDVVTALAAQVERAGIEPRVVVALGGGGAGALPEPTDVLITGWVWRNRQHGAGVLIHAMERATGRVLSTFKAAELNDEAESGFRQWCAALRLAEGAESEAMAVAGERSGLLDAELDLPPLHPVWRQLTIGSASSVVLASAAAAGAEPDDAVTLALGLATPPSLRPTEPPRRRDPYDPLAPVRPIAAPPYPPMFDRWTEAYGRYVRDDFDAFQKSIERIGELLRDRGAFVPRLIVRGRTRYDGSTPMDSAGRLSTSPVALNLRQFVQIGGSGVPLVDYRSDLADAFRRRPWTLYHAWRHVPASIAEPFLKAQWVGVTEQGYGRPPVLTRGRVTVPSLDVYVATVLLSEMGNGAAIGFRTQARALADRVFTESISGGGRHASDAGAAAMRLLLFENDRDAVRLLQSPELMRLHVTVPSDRAADTLRLLLDRVGPAAWAWAQDQPDADWSALVFRDADEIAMFLEMLPGALEPGVERQLRAWLGMTSTRSAEVTP